MTLSTDNRFNDLLDKLVDEVKMECTLESEICSLENEHANIPEFISTIGKSSLEYAIVGESNTAKRKSLERYLDRHRKNLADSKNRQSDIRNELNILYDERR